MSSSSSSSKVSVVASNAPLLSGGLEDCLSPDDETCEAGFAAVSARMRQHSEPTLVLPQLDKTSPFVHMHPFKWAVNLLVLQGLFGWSLFVSSPSILTAGNDLTLLQSTRMPLLLTNSVVPPSSSWQAFHETVHFDTNTGLAVLSIADSGQTYNWPQIESTQGGLDYIARINAELGCSTNLLSFDAMPEGWNIESDIEPGECWTPIVYYADTSQKRLEEFVSAISALEHAPALIVDTEAGHENYTVPVLVNNTWVVSYILRSDSISIVELTLDEEKAVTAVNMTTQDLTVLPEEVKDITYAGHIVYLRTLANEAEVNDPIVGYTREMPAIRDLNQTTYRRCKGGECEMGNLFTDALRWYTEVDIAFITSGGLRGYGWEAGEVHVSDLFGALPFPNIPCLGVMSGISLFRLLNYTTSVSTFESGDTDAGGRLLQVSGIKYKYNTQLKGSRLVAIDVWDEDTQEYLPVERLKLYKFATDSYLCGDYDPYPSFLTEELTMEGEEPGVIEDLGLHQTIVGEYLSQLEEPYDTAIQGRLINNTEATEVLNLIQTEDSCPSNSYWDEEQVTCVPCPDASNVAFSDEELEFQAESGSEVSTVGRVVLVNREIYSVRVVPKSIPHWFEFTGSSLNSTILAVGSKPVLLLPGESVAIEFEIEAFGLEAGTAQGTVSFAVQDVGDSPRCIGRDAHFDVFVRVAPPPDMNQLSAGVRAGGLSLMGIIVCASLFFALLVLFRRKHHIVRTLQPVFLMMICFGVLVIGMTILPLSIDDAVANQRGCDIACMSTPWLLIMGLMVSFSALFSKLWRINKLFHAATFTRIQVREKDVLAPFAVLFVLNFSFLLTWTLVDPLRWKRESVDGSLWNSYGHCEGNGVVSTVMLALTAAVNVGALFLACFQAYRARDISDEFSESKYVGIALYSWLQVLIVGVPVIFLIDDSNPTARYFLQAGLLFTLCMSMLLLIFAPLVLNWWKATRPGQSSHDNVRISGLHGSHTRAVSTSGTSSAELSRSMFGNSSSTEVTDEKYHIGLSTLKEVSSEMLSADTLSLPKGDAESGIPEVENNSTSDSGPPAEEEGSMESLAAVTGMNAVNPSLRKDLASESSAPMAE